jgi:hypothetical protein
MLVGEGGVCIVELCVGPVSFRSLVQTVTNMPAFRRPVFVLTDVLRDMT